MTAADGGPGTNCSPADKEGEGGGIGCTRKLII